MAKHPSKIRYLFTPQVMCRAELDRGARPHRTSTIRESMKTLAACVLSMCAVSLACRGQGNYQGTLDASVRGSLPVGIWESLDNEFKYRACLRYKVGVIRNFVSEVDGIIPLVEYYPTWEQKLQECTQTYDLDTSQQAARLREALVTRMAEVLGEETTSYLLTAHLFSARMTEAAWVDEWRTTAIVGIAGVADVVPEER